MSMGTLHDRLSAIAGNRTYRSLGDLTQTNHETVRRYMQGQAPSVEFLITLCSALEINPAWLLTGQGPMRLSDMRAAALGEADVSELLNALANSLSSLIERVERLEIYIQTMESRLRSVTKATLDQIEVKPDQSQDGTQAPDGAAAARPNHDGTATDGRHAPTHSANYAAAHSTKQSGHQPTSQSTSQPVSQSTNHPPHPHAADPYRSSTIEPQPGNRPKARRIADALPQRPPEDAH